MRLINLTKVVFVLLLLVLPKLTMAAVTPATVSAVNSIHKRVRLEKLNFYAVFSTIQAWPLKFTSSMTALRSAWALRHLMKYLRKTLGFRWSRCSRLHLWLEFRRYSLPWSHYERSKTRVNRRAYAITSKDITSFWKNSGKHISNFSWVAPAQCEYWWRYCDQQLRINWRLLTFWRFSEKLWIKGSGLKNWTFMLFFQLFKPDPLIMQKNAQ